MSLIFSSRKLVLKNKYLAFHMLSLEDFHGVKLCLVLAQLLLMRGERENSIKSHFSSLFILVDEQEFQSPCSIKQGIAHCYTSMASWTSTPTCKRRQRWLGEAGWAETWLCPRLSAAASTDPMPTRESTSKDPNPTALHQWTDYLRGASFHAAIYIGNTNFWFLI